MEQVRVGKEVQERTEAINDTVRRRDVDVERMEGQGARRDTRERAMVSDESAPTRDTARTERDMFSEPNGRSDSPTKRDR